MDRPSTRDVDYHAFPQRHRYGRPGRAGDEHLLRRPRRCSTTGSPTGIGCSNWRPTAPFPPNMSCCAIISASPSTRCWKPRSPTICAAFRARMAAGRWCMTAPFDMSASVKAYFALKMIGDSVDAPHMARAREAIRSRGGAVNSNVFTRFLLALFGVVTWRACRCCRSRSCCCRCGRRSTSTRSPTGRAPPSCR